MAETGVVADQGPAEVVAALIRLGLAEPGDAPAFTALTGGVSSDIWRVELPGGPVCVKRALAELRVAAHWQAPIERNLYEARWMRRAGAVVPEAVPELLGQDQAGGVLVMAYLAPEDHGLWKAPRPTGSSTRSAWSPTCWPPPRLIRTGPPHWKRWPPRPPVPSAPWSTAT
jgi:hypothetical protein